MQYLERYFASLLICAILHIYKFSIMCGYRKISYFKAFVGYLGFYVVFWLSVLNKFIFHPKSAGIFYKTRFKGFFNLFDEIYINYIYRRIRDCSHTPVSGHSGSTIQIKDRTSDDYWWTLRETGEQRKCINLGSFNYLNLSELKRQSFDEIANTIERYGVAVSPCSPDISRNTLHEELEKLTAQFLGLEDVFTFCTGFDTNISNLPAILSKECVVLSDEKNHASMIMGIRLSGASVVQYKHCDNQDLERKIVRVLSENDRKRFFSKLFIITEGIYSVDGTVVDLLEIIRIKKKYKAYLYIDDAHGVGILNENCRGIVGTKGIDPKDIDILMGTYSKAFASNGGFIGGSKALIRHLRSHSFTIYGTSMQPAAVKKAIMSIKTLVMHDEPTGNILGMKIRDRAYYLRSNLRKIGLQILGRDDSHIIPWVLGSVSAVSFIIRELKKRGVAAAGVIYPATSLQQARIRLNVSAFHTVEQLDTVIEEIKNIKEIYGL